MSVATTVSPIMSEGRFSASPGTVRLKNSPHIVKLALAISYWMVMKKKKLNLKNYSLKQYENKSKLFIFTYMHNLMLSQAREMFHLSHLLDHLYLL